MWNPFKRRPVTYFFSAMAQPTPGTLHYTQGTLTTTHDPSTKDGLDAIVDGVGKSMIPPRTGVTLLSFNRI